MLLVVREGTFLAAITIDSIFSFQLNHTSKELLVLLVPGWLQVDLLEPTLVSGFIIQGRVKPQHVTSLHFLYSNNTWTWHKATEDGYDVSLIFVVASSH